MRSEYTPEVLTEKHRCQGVRQFGPTPFKKMTMEQMWDGRQKCPSTRVSVPVEPTSPRRW